jgi:hypothetical protein
VLDEVELLVARGHGEVVPADGQVGDEVFPDAAEPHLLNRGERPAGGQPGERPAHPLGGREQRFGVVRRVLDHRDDVHERLVVPQPVGLLQVVRGEPQRAGAELRPQLGERVRPPPLRAVEQDADGLDPGRVVADVGGELAQVVGRLVLLSVGVPEQVLGRHRVHVLDGLQERIPLHAGASSPIPCENWSCAVFVGRHGC